MKKVFKVLGILVLLLVVCVAGVAVYIKTALPDVGDAPVMQVDITPERVSRGEYLANSVMVCMDCHSTRNWNEFSAPPVPGTLGKGGDRFDREMGMPGIFYARNITPAGLKDWTDGEVFRAITSGVSKDGRPLFPLMPHPAYGQLDEEDIKSVIAYLRTLPAIENEVPLPEVDFPFSYILNTIPKKPAFTKKPAETDTLAYGKYLITAASCVECHSPFEKGAPVFEKAFSGGRAFPMPTGTLYTSNLTPHETGIKNWTKEMFIERFKMYADSGRQHVPVKQGDFNTIMPWTMYANMKESDLGAIYAFLRTVPALENKVEKFVPRK